MNTHFFKTTICAVTLACGCCLFAGSDSWTDSNNHFSYTKTQKITAEKVDGGGVKYVFSLSAPRYPFDAATGSCSPGEIKYGGIKSGPAGSATGTAEYNQSSLPVADVNMTMSGELLPPASDKGGSKPTWSATATLDAPFHIKSDQNGGEKEIVVPHGTSVKYSAYSGTSLQNSTWSVTGFPSKEAEEIRFNKSFWASLWPWSAPNITDPEPGVYNISATAKSPATGSDSGKMTIVGIDIVINKNSFTLKYDCDAVIDIKAIPSTAQNQLSDHKIEIARTDYLLWPSWYTLSAGQASFNWTTRIAGTFKIRAKAKFQGVELESKEVEVNVLFPTQSQIAGDITSQMTSEWSNTISDANATQRRERGFWVTINTSNNTIVTGNSVMGPWVDNATGAYINPGNAPGVSVNSPNPNANGAIYAINFFHTHTPVFYRGAGVARGVGPSDGDEAWDDSNNMTLFAYDYVGSAGYIYSNMPINSPSKNYFCSLNRRDINK